MHPRPTMGALPGPCLAPVRISLLSLIALVAACRGEFDHEQDAVSTSRNGVSATPVSGTNTMPTRFAPSPIEVRASRIFGPGSGEILTALDRWRRREAACRIESCRQEVRRERERRLAFALGMPVGPISGIPLSSGRFELVNERRFGTLYLLPLEDGSILVETQIITRNGNRDCEMAASGRFLSNDEAILEFTDNHGLPPRFKLLVRTIRELTLEPFEYEADGVCSIANPWGNYRAE